MDQGKTPGVRIRGDSTHGIHISRAFDGALATLHLRVVEMGGLVLEQIREAAAAYTAWGPESARHVLNLSQEICGYSTRISEAQLILIARYQPVAGDLRTVLTLAKVVAQLERASEEAQRIARTVTAHEIGPDPGVCRDVSSMAQLTIRFFRSGLEALDRLDAPLALDVIVRDEGKLSGEYAAALQRLMTCAAEDPRRVGVAIDAAFALKSLVRIADHARDLAQYVARVEPCRRSGCTCVQGRRSLFSDVEPHRNVPTA
jgi:phosphate transport system protein